MKETSGPGYLNRVHKRGQYMQFSGSKPMGSIRGLSCGHATNLQGYMYYHTQYPLQ